ncbi:MAG: primosomal protein N' [Eubacterium sp.]|nr:primosomal protein N' [Eubacterium sp.]
MSVRYADIIIDISQSNVDRPFRYRIPEELEESVKVGSAVKVPFGNGNRLRTGYVIGLADEPNWDIDKIKDIQNVSNTSLDVESKLILLAGWMKETYGSTMISALRTVMPVKERVRERKNQIDIMDMVPEFRPIGELEGDQKAVVDDFVAEYNLDTNGISDSDNSDSRGNICYLLHGVTGSGKTEVYIRMAEEVIKSGRDVIVLVPEIALTYQTVARFSSYFRDSISILNSQLSKGEKYREFMKAREGKTHIMIGPRSALFAPFRNLGLIIIDEEHDNSYKSEMTPKYHAREVAIKRAELEGAKVVLGSATPSVESYYKAQNGEYKLYELTQRVSGAELPEVDIVDLREELRMGNRSIISKLLYDKLNAAFDRGEQAMLFINRRGFNSFVSCRSCGEVVKCPNCDVSLSLHLGDKLMCHYCGYTARSPKSCPKCSSKLIGGYGTGTEKLEQEIKRIFPGIRTLRMDRDTTVKKGSHGDIIQKFREGKADCLIGTQMIVKGHDFPNVTVVGAILADLSLFDSDYRSAERTFDLLVQAAGRAGRAELPGSVVIQTYQPEHYAIMSSIKQDYKAFYDYEILYRKLLKYPPLSDVLCISISSPEENYLIDVMDKTAAEVRKYLEQFGDAYECVGPAQAHIYRINNVYKKVFYIKSDKPEILSSVTEHISDWMEKNELTSDKLEVQYDINPM